jgi:hypothetical protein
VEEEVISGRGWWADISMSDGTVRRIPVLAWARIPHGMGPLIVLPGDMHATLFNGGYQGAVLLREKKDIAEITVRHPDAMQTRAATPDEAGSPPLPGQGTPGDRLLPDVGSR